MTDVTSSEPAARVVEAITQRIVRDFDPEQIILFGSQARGDAHASSDIDLLVVMEYSGSRRLAETRIYHALAEYPAAVDVVVVTPEYLARKRNVLGTIVYPALREGQVLYTRGRRPLASDLHNGVMQTWAAASRSRGATHGNHRAMRACVDASMRA